MKSQRKAANLAKRVLSFVLAFVMMISLVPGTPGLENVQAADEYSVTLHYRNDNNWANVNCYSWDAYGNELLGGRPGTAMTTNENNDNWYDIVLNNVSAGVVNVVFNNGNGSQTADLSFEINGTTEVWATDTAQNKFVFEAPEGWSTESNNDLTIHYNNPNKWTSVCAYVWDDNGSTLLGGWPGTAISENTEHAGWYDVTLEDVAGTKVNFIFNNNNGGQTSNLSNADVLDAKELWVVGETVTAEESWGENPGGNPEETGYKLTVHYNNPNRWEKVYGYAWNPASNAQLLGAWPGTELSENATHAGWYDLVVKNLEAGTVGFIFNSGSGVQTENLSAVIKDKDVELWYDGETFSEEESWDGIQKEEAEVNSSFRPVDKLEVKVGDQMITMDVYMNGTFEAQAELPAGDYTATLVVNGEETSDVVNGTLGAKGTVIFRTVEDKLTVVEKGLSAALVGNFAGISFADGIGIDSWTPADADAELTYLGGGLYKGTFNFEALTADLALADGGYKVAFDDGWYFSIGEGSGNIPLTIPAGTSHLTVYADAVNGVVYDSVRSADFTVVQNSGSLTKPAFDTTISIIGSVRGNEDINWITVTTGYEFTQISEKLYRYQETYTTGEYAYKCVFAGSWYEAEPGNRTITLTEDTHVVFLYDTESGKLYDTVNNPKEVAEFLHMTATGAEMKIVDKLNGTTSFVAAVEGAATVDLYYGDKAEVKTKGTEALNKVTLSKASNGTFQSSDLFLGDEALEIVFYYDVNNGTKTLDSSKETVTISGEKYSVYTREAFAGRIVSVPGTFPGPSWNPNSNFMTYIGNGLYEYTFEDVPSATYEYKIAINKGWGENYGADGNKDGANIPVMVPSTQDVTIWYNDFSNRTVCSVNYIFADITLEGSNVAAGTKLTDDKLTGIYSAAVTLPAGTYSDHKLVYDGKDYAFAAFTIENEKVVNYYMDPVTGIYYNDASDKPVEAASIYFDSKDKAYKSVFGAIEEGEKVTFSIDTGADATAVTLVFKGSEVLSYQMKKDANANRFSTDVVIDTLGEYQYYFAVSNGSSIKIYTDDDGYYGTGHVVDLANLTTYYDLVVYEKGFETPDWMKNAVIYQIFPDRFYDGKESNNDNQKHARGAVDYEYITDWYALPENPEQEALVSKDVYESTGAYWGDGEWSNEIYGGDLKGIVEKIDYLKELGVNVIYLNPVFASISSHRYDTSDYMEIDPILGTEGDFAELVKVAEENGMKIILDGVFNHVSDDSIYFDRYYRYLGTSEKIGAYPYWAYVYDRMNEDGMTKDEAEKAARKHFTKEYGVTDYAYTEWVEVFNEQLIDVDGEAATDTIGLRAGKPVYRYDGWWGYDSMPVIKSTNGSEYQTGNWAEEIIYAEDGSSATQYWISKGNNGWRLDVANEVSDETWQNFRESVKGLDSEAVIVGEIWTDATKYLMGDMYDSVMNYVFRGAVTGFAMDTSAEDTTKTMEKLRERYPEEAFYAMMNLVASHDTSRVLSYLDGIGDDRADKSLNAAFPTFESASQNAKDRQKLVAFLQFTYAGAPTIYYGDEIAMAGSDDPDDRRGFTWGKGDKETLLWYATLSDIRSKYEELRTGSVEAFTLNENLMGYVRRLNESTEKDFAIVVANKGNATPETIDLTKLNITATKFVDLISGIEYTVVSRSNILNVEIPALNKGGVILVPAEEAVEIFVNESALESAYEADYVIEERAEVPPADSDNNPEDDDPDKKPGNEGGGKPGIPKPESGASGNSSSKEETADKEVYPAPNTSADAQNGAGASTGDTSANIYVLCALMVCAATAVIIVNKKRKRQ